MGDASTTEAKRELTLQLIDMLTEHLYHGIKSIYDKTKEEGISNVLRRFQEKLQSIPIWNQEIIDKEFERIISKKDTEHLDKLLDMLFISHVKVLSVLKINENNKIDIQVPNAKVFIHKCYIECARSFYRDPYLIDDRVKNYDYSEIQRNIKRSNVVINHAIERTVRDLIPLKDILEAYSKSIEDEVKPENVIEDIEEDLNDIKSEQSEENEENESEKQIENNEEIENQEISENPDTYIDKAFTMQPNLNVTTGQQISETPPHQFDPSQQLNNTTNTFEPQLNYTNTFEPPSQLNNTYEEETQNEFRPYQDDGIKNILIQGNSRNHENPKAVTNHQSIDDDNFFSDDEN